MFAAKHRLKYLLLVLAALTLAACTSPPQPLAPLAEDAVIVALGDSLTFGAGGRGANYPQQLEKIIGRTVINAGISGETSTGAKARAQRVIARYKPQLLIVCTGGNDFLQRQDAAITEKNISDIVEIAQANGVPVVLIAVPRVIFFPINHSLYGKVAGKYQLWLEDEVLKTVLHDDSLKSDRIHPNARGYHIIAEAVADLLRASGAIPL